MTEGASGQELDPILVVALALVAEHDPDDLAAEVGRIYLESSAHA